MEPTSMEPYGSYRGCCKIPGCRAKFFDRKEEEMHKKRCAYLENYCPFECGVKVLNKDLVTHLTKFCSKRFLYKRDDESEACKSCGSKISKSSMEAHYKECTTVELPCSMRYLGCEFVGKAVERLAHENDVQIHMPLLALTVRNIDNLMKVADCIGAAVKDKGSSVDISSIIESFERVKIQIQQNEIQGNLANIMKHIERFERDLGELRNIEIEQGSTRINTNRPLGRQSTEHRPRWNPKMTLAELRSHLYAGVTSVTATTDEIDYRHLPAWVKPGKVDMEVCGRNRNLEFWTRSGNHSAHIEITFKLEDVLSHRVTMSLSHPSNSHIFFYQTSNVQDQSTCTFCFRRRSYMKYADQSLPTTTLVFSANE